MAVAYQTGTHGCTPAGFEMFDISNPEAPRAIGFFDCSGPRSRGVHQVWFIDGKTVYCSSGAPDFTPRNLLDDQPFRAIDVSDPTKPREICRWWYPGVAEGDQAPPPPRHPKFNSGWRAHNTNVYPERPDRAVSRLSRRRAPSSSTFGDLGAPKAGGALESAPAVPRLHPHRHAAVRPRPADRAATNACAPRASTGPSWSGCWTRGARIT